ncbi:MAG TPA: PASTA domain-containing protein, partial [Chloroflexota bacterium]|nr:PASTA domain-containing protein [Chloroflexota bacterium]
TRDVPRGVIAAQEPAANARLEIGKPVRVIVSKGPQRVAVPNVVGATFAEATERLAAAGFKVQRQDEYNDRAVTGTVFQQAPTGEADAGSTVTVRVSLGRNLITVPEVRGRSEQDARQALEREGFKVDVEYDRFAGVDPGQVFVTDPAPQARLERGSSVTIRVRRDPTPVPATPTTAPAPTATRVPATATSAPAPSPTAAPRTTPAASNGQQPQAPGQQAAAQASPAAPQPTATSQGR